MRVTGAGDNDVAYQKRRRREGIERRGEKLVIMMLHIRMKKERKGRDREERRKAGDNDVAYQNEKGDEGKGRDREERRKAGDNDAAYQNEKGDEGKG